MRLKIAFVGLKVVVKVLFALFRLQFLQLLQIYIPCFWKLLSQ